MSGVFSSGVHVNVPGVPTSHPRVSVSTYWSNEVNSLALALNRSLETLKMLNISLADYRFGQTTITNAIAENFDHVTFQGAAGYIKFNSYQEAGSSVNIFQIQSGHPVLV